MRITLRAWRHAVAALVAVLGLMAMGLAAASGTAMAGTAASHSADASMPEIIGAGSSWAAVALSQWQTEAKNLGIDVNYTASGSAEGRILYIEKELDFAGSDPPFNSTEDVLAGISPEYVPFDYSYVPDTAGGTAFMYNLVVAGHQIRNLRLSPSTLMGIFTGKITNWDAPQITQDYGQQLPSIPIIPVVRSDASGATYFLTQWFQYLNQNAWNSFCQQVHPGIKLPCGDTEVYPATGWNPNVKALDGSDPVAGFINSAAGQGSIGYDEMAYALNDNLPVVAVRNNGGYYVLPSASNVAVALSYASINEDTKSPNYLQQNLSGVYATKDPRAYPLSEYSYLIVPKKPAWSPFFNSPPGKGATLSRFIDYYLCAGQSQLENIGYSPLPGNLVDGAATQVDEMPGTVGGPSTTALGKCQNPADIDGKDNLLDTAPYPPSCEKVGAQLSSIVTDAAGDRPNNWSCTASGGSTSSGAGGASTKTGKGSGTDSGATGTGTGPGSVGGGGGPGSEGPVTPQVVNLAADPTSQAMLSGLTALALVLAVALPPALAVWMRRRKSQPHG